MAARGISTKEKMLILVNDIEIITKELLETLIAKKQEKLSHAEQSQLINLIMEKNNELKNTLDLAHEQADIEEKIREVNNEVGRYDGDIQMLQKSLKEAESLLSTAIYQAKQKLEQINRAHTHQVNSEDLIRFAHRISSTNAVASPLNWQPGDPRRPYPTDLEMRMGLLGRLNDLPLSAPPTSLLDQQNLNQNPGNPFPSWHPHAQGNHQGGTTPEYPGAWSGFTGGSYPVVDSYSKNHEDVEVEVMSTEDSSSSTSSDSQ